MNEAHEGIHARCNEFKDLGDGYTLYCGRSAGHTDAKDPKRRLHYDASVEASWADDSETVERYSLQQKTESGGKIAWRLITEFVGADAYAKAVEEANLLYRQDFKSLRGVRTFRVVHTDITDVIGDTGQARE